MNISNQDNLYVLVRPLDLQKKYTPNKKGGAGSTPPHKNKTDDFYKLKIRKNF